MARLQSNDSAALEISSAAMPALCSPCKRHVRDSGEAEDCPFREAFFYLYKKSMLFDGSKAHCKKLDTQSRFTRRWTKVALNSQGLLYW